ncbi:GNAT family N-acetyltransferase [Streptomyces sp. NPDC056387]|uniref:GNAT family N-acetyltransferase n=1 Tax=Streptomyces sp. NPDC056387 TaxID=3345803 RepID=UPI0035D78149
MLLQPKPPRPKQQAYGHASRGPPETDTSKASIAPRLAIHPVFHPGIASGIDPPPSVRSHPSHPRAPQAWETPAEGDRVIAGLLGDNPAWPGVYGHRLITEQDGGLIIGSIGLCWPLAEGAIELGYGVVASRRELGYATEATRAGPHSP